MHLQRHSIEKERRSCDVLPSKQADAGSRPVSRFVNLSTGVFVMAIGCA